MKKEIRINVRTTDQIKRELEITATRRGMTASSLVNWLVVGAIREEKQVSPEAFEKVEIDRSPGSGEDPPVREEVPEWKHALRKAKGMWKDRKDLPDLREIRKEADRSDRWNEA